MLASESKLLIDALLHFVDDGHATDTLVVARRWMTPQELRVVAIKILSWLKSQSRLRKKFPLKLNREYRWCHNLGQWLTEDAQAATIFIVSDNCCELHGDVDDAITAEILREVDERFQPPLMKSS